MLEIQWNISSSLGLGKVARRVGAYLGALCVLCGSILSTESADAASEAPAKVTYQEHVRPIFQEHCFACHSQDDKTSDLALDSYAAALAGGAGGEALAAGDLAGSRLWQLVSHKTSPQMPPDQDKLPQPQLDVIQAWIEGGLLENAGSKPKKLQSSALAPVEPTADNRPAGEPAMPHGVFREPVVATSHAGAVSSLAASPWAPLVAVPGPRQVSLYHIESGELLGILPYPEGTPNVVRLSRDGSLLVVGGGRGGAFGNVAVYDVASGGRLGAYGEEIDAVLAADISPDQSLVALGGPKKVVRVYRVADGSLAYEIRKHTDWVTAIEFSPDGKLLATADRAGGLLLWDAAAGNERADLRGHQEQVTAVSWRADSRALASASEDDTVRLWQPDGKQLKSFAAHAGGTLAVQFSRDAQLVTAGRDFKVKTWAADGKPIKEVAKLKDAALAACLSHDGSRIVAADWTGNVQSFDAATGKSVHALPANPPTLARRTQQAEAELAPAQQALGAAERDAIAARAISDAAAEALATHQRELAAALAVLEGLSRDRVAAAAIASQAASVRGPAAAAAIADATKRVATIEEAAAAAQAKVAAVAQRRPDDAAADALAAAATKADQRLAAARRTLSEAKAARDAARAELATFSRAEEQFASQAAKLQRQLAAQQQRLAGLVDEQDRLASISSRLEEEIAELEKRRSKNAAEAQAHAKLVEQTEAERAALDRQAALNESQRTQFQAAAELRAAYADMTKRSANLIQQER